MELCLLPQTYYRVKRGQTLAEIAGVFCTTPRLLALQNALTAEPEEGQVLSLPPAGNVYRVRGGESKELLCGSREAFEQRNGTTHLYVGQTVLI